MSAHIQSERISSKSVWSDSSWFIGEVDFGGEPSQYVINWDFQLEDGRRFIDDPDSKIINESKALVAAMIAAQLKPRTITKHFYYLRVVLIWMSGQYIESFAELTPAALEVLGDYIQARHLLRPSTKHGKERNVLYMRERCFQAVTLIWDYREALRQRELAGLPQEPWGGMRPQEIVGASPAKQTPPLPDEVAIPILNEAASLINEWVVRDIVQLMDTYQSIAGVNIVGGSANRAREAVGKFKFSNTPSTNKPWHVPLSHASRRYNADAPTALVAARQLLLDLNTASIIIIQSCTGMRSSEICSMKSGIDSSTGLPLSIKIEPSVSGLYEMFTIEAKLIKGSQDKKPAFFLAGMRVAGTQTVPIAVRAILVLETLWQRWRVGEIANVLTLRPASRGFPRSNAVLAPLTIADIGLDLQAFIRNRVDLSRLPDTSFDSKIAGNLKPYKSSKGAIVKPTQWRKTLANFVVRFDTRILPALSQQFHHYKIAITEENYINECFTLYGDLHDIREQITSHKLLLLSNGDTAGVGRMARRLDALKKELQSLVQEHPDYERRDTMLRFVKQHGLLIWEAQYGNCLAIDRAEMRCHALGGTTAGKDHRPNFAFQSPHTCLGCECLIVDQSHLAYWEDRREYYREIEGDISLPEASRKLARRRHTQAVAVVKQLMGAAPAQ